MPKPPLPQSLLSAYFDGEVSAEERAAVSRAAQKSPAAQQVLDEYAQLSGSLKSLRESVPSPQLRDAVLAAIQPPQPSQLSPSSQLSQSSPSSASREKPSVSSAQSLLHRRWVQVAGGILAASAAGLLLMVDFAGPRPENAAPFMAGDFVASDLATNDLATNDVATNAAPLPAVSSDMALARSEPSSGRVREELELTSEPGGASLAAAAGSLGKLKETPDRAALATDGSGEALERTAAIPADWYTQQIVNDDRTPQPGDVMTYLRRVADETVVISVTVVDVQMTAGRIQLLLADHGMRSLPMEKSDTTDADGTDSATDAVDASSVAILVESDWDRFSAVMDDLDTLDSEGMGVATYVEWPPATRRAMMKQSSIGSASKPAPPGPQQTPSAARPAAALLAESVPPDAKPDAPGQSPALARSPALAEGLPAISNGLFLQAPVTDAFVAELDLRQQAVASDSAAPAIAESSVADRPAEQRKRKLPDSDSGDAQRRKFGLPFASHGPARVVFLIKKSGNAP